MGFFSNLTEDDFKVDDEVKEVKPIVIGKKQESAPVVEEENGLNVDIPAPKPEKVSAPIPEPAPKEVPYPEIQPKKKKESGGEFVLPSGVTIEGNIRATVPVKIQGVVTGDIDTDAMITIENSEIGGNICSRNGDVIVTGESILTSNISSDGTVLIESGSTITGKITGMNITVKGIVKGDLEAVKTVTLKSGAKVRGNISCADVEIEKGAIIAGGSITQTSAENEDW